VFAKSSGIAFAEFLWVQQFSEIAFRIGAEIPKSENCIGIFLIYYKKIVVLCAR
jgi:hypothetical protein